MPSPLYGLGLPARPPKGEGFVLKRNLAHNGRVRDENRAEGGGELRRSSEARSLEGREGSYRFSASGAPEIVSLCERSGEFVAGVKLGSESVT
jgi:hypothetical protein